MIQAPSRRAPRARTPHIVPKEAAPPSPVNAAASTLAAILSAAENPAIDAEKLERLFDLHERLLNRNAEQAFIQAMHAAQAEIEPVRRRGRNDTTRSSYAKLEDISAALRPIMERHGFAPSFTTEESALAGHYRIVLMLSHIDGFTRRYGHDVPIDSTGMKGTANKTATHAYGSTLSYGERYALVAAFNIPTSDDDGNAAGGAGPGPREPVGADAPISAKQAATLRSKIADARYQVTEAPILTKFQVERIEDLTVGQFDAVCRQLEDRAKRLAAAGGKAAE